MKLSKQEVAHIANLARLELSNKEQEEMRQQLSEILNYVNKLQELDTKNVKPMNQVTGLVNVTRSDILEPFRDYPKILEQVPVKENNLVKVKGVFE